MPVNEYGQMIGEAMEDYTPGALPSIDFLEGRYARIEALSVDKHAEDLLAVYGPDTPREMWTYLFQEPVADMEELVSIGAVGLIKAVDTFDQEKASKLATYAARCVENEILMYLRVRKKISRESSYYEPIGTDKEGNEIRLLDIMESQDPEALDVIELKDDTRKIYTLLDRVLTPRERQVLIMRYGLYQGKECTQREIAEELGISRSYISRIEKNALQRLREHFQD